MKMDNYSQWQEYKTYEGHLERLKKLSAKEQKHSHNKNNNSNGLQEFSKSNHYRSKTEQLQKTRKKTNMGMLRVPIPLVSSSQGKLIKDTLNAGHVSLKDKQHILQNYLLSRRILKTKPTIKIQSSFSSSRKLIHNSSSKNMVKSSRDKKFRIYSKQKEQLKNLSEIAEGSNYLQFKIKHIMMIKGVLGRGRETAYNLDIKVGKYQKKQVRALSYEELFRRNFRIRWKSGLCNKKPQILVIINVLRQNFSQELGLFRLSISEFEHGYTERSRKVYRIMKGKFPVGTIELQGGVIYKKRDYTRKQDQYLTKQYQTRYIEGGHDDSELSKQEKNLLPVQYSKK